MCPSCSMIASAVCCSWTQAHWLLLRSFLPSLGHVTVNGEGKALRPMGEERGLLPHPVLAPPTNPSGPFACTSYALSGRSGFTGMRWLMTDSELKNVPAWVSVVVNIHVICYLKFTELCNISVLPVSKVGVLFVSLIACSKDWCLLLFFSPKLHPAIICPLIFWTMLLSPILQLQGV